MNELPKGKNAEDHLASEMSGSDDQERLNDRLVYHFFSLARLCITAQRAACSRPVGGWAGRSAAAETAALTA